MNITYVYYEQCPYCRKDIEIQIIPSKIKVNLVKEEETINGDYGYQCRILRKELGRKKLVKKLLNLKKAMYQEGKTENGIPLDRIKVLANGLGIDEKNFNLVLSNLQANFDVCRLENGNYLIISM